MVLPLCTDRDPNAGKAGVTVAMDLVVALVNVGRGLDVADVVAATLPRIEAEVVLVLPTSGEDVDPRNN